VTKRAMGTAAGAVGGGEGDVGKDDDDKG